MAGPLETEIEQMLNDALADTILAFEAEVTGATNLAELFHGLSPDDRDEMMLLTYVGLANALRRIARAVDEAGR